MADQIFQVNSSSFQDVEISASLRAGPSITVDFSKASTVTGSFSGAGGNLTNVSASYIVPTANATASWSNTASVALTAINATSASFLSTGQASINGTLNQSTHFILLATGSGTHLIRTDTSSNFTWNPASTTLIASNISASSITSSQRIEVGPISSTDNSRLHISASDTSNTNLFEVDGYNQDKSFVVNSTGSMSATGSLWGTASYALTASYLITQQTTFISASVTKTTNVSAIATPLSFSIAPGEIWVSTANTSVQSNNNRGMRYAISSSVASPAMDLINGWILAATNAITTQTNVQFPDVNVVEATSLHTQANTPASDLIWFTVANNSTASAVISLAIAVTNNADTVTLFSGSFMTARKIV